jgi:hypothetical protein
MVTGKLSRAVFRKMPWWERLWRWVTRQPKFKFEYKSLYADIRFPRSSDDEVDEP